MAIVKKPLTALTPQQAAAQGYSYSGAVGWYKNVIQLPPSPTGQKPIIVGETQSVHNIPAAQYANSKTDQSYTPPDTTQTTTPDTQTATATPPANAAKPELDYRQPEQVRQKLYPMSFWKPKIEDKPEEKIKFSQDKTQPKTIVQIAQKIKTFEENKIDPLAPIMEKVTQTKTQTGGGRDIKITETRESAYKDTKTIGGFVKSAIYGGYHGAKELGTWTAKAGQSIFTTGKKAGVATAAAQQHAATTAKQALQQHPDLELIKSKIGGEIQADQSKIQKKMYAFNAAMTKEYNVSAEGEIAKQNIKDAAQKAAAVGSAAVIAESELLKQDYGHIGRFVGGVATTTIALGAVERGLSAVGRAATGTPQLVKVDITKQITRETSRDTSKMIDKPTPYNIKPPQQIKIQKETIQTTPSEAKKLIAQQSKPDAFAITKTSYIQKGYTQKEAADTFQHSRLSYIQKATPDMIKELSTPTANKVKALNEVKTKITQELNAIGSQTPTRKLYYHIQQINVGDSIAKMTDDIKAEIKQTGGAKLSGTTKVIEYNKDIFKHEAQNIPPLLLYEKDTIKPLKMVAAKPTPPPIEDGFKVIKPDPNFIGTDWDKTFGNIEKAIEAKPIKTKWKPYKINAPDQAATGTAEKLIPKTAIEYEETYIATPHTETFQEAAKQTMNTAGLATATKTMIHSDLAILTKTKTQNSALTALKPPKMEIKTSQATYQELKPIEINIPEADIRFKIMPPKSKYAQDYKTDIKPIQDQAQKYAQKPDTIIETKPIQKIDFKPIRPLKYEFTDIPPPSRITPYLPKKSAQHLYSKTKTQDYIGYQPIYINPKGKFLKYSNQLIFKTKNMAIGYAAEKALSKKRITGFKIKDIKTQSRPIQKETNITRQKIQEEFKLIGQYYIEKSKIKPQLKKKKWF